MRRGLCQRCHRDPGVRDDYPCLPRGPWKAIGRVWDVTDRCLLMDMFEAGLSDKQIARQLRRTVGAIGKQRWRMGMRVPPSRQELHRAEERAKVRANAS